MAGRITVGLVAGALLLCCYWLEDHWESGRALPEEYTHGPEARAWLQKSKNESALASNRFGETANARQFVSELYQAGAVRVIVPQTCITNDGVEIYADALVVTLPSDPDKRTKVWRLCSAELVRQGEKPPANPSEDRILLWWD